MATGKWLIQVPVGWALREGTAKNAKDLKRLAQRQQIALCVFFAIFAVTRPPSPLSRLKKSAPSGTLRRVRRY
jgi:hypothetical protein